MLYTLVKKSYNNRTAVAYIDIQRRRVRAHPCQDNTLFIVPDFWVICFGLYVQNRRPA